MVDQTGFFKILLKTLSEIPHEIFIEMSTLIIKNLLKNSSILNYEMLHFDRDDNCHKGSVVWLICDPNNRKSPKKLSDIGFDPPG